VDAPSQLRRHLAGDRLAAEGVAEADAPMLMRDEHAGGEQARHADARVERELAGVALPVEAPEHSRDLGDGDVRAQQGDEPRVRPQRRGERVDLAVGEPVEDRQLGEALDLVGREVVAVALGLPADKALALQSAHELDEQQRHGLRALDEPLHRALGDVLRGQEQLAAEGGGVLGRERASRWERCEEKGAGVKGQSLPMCVALRSLARANDRVSPSVAEGFR